MPIIIIIIIIPYTRTDTRYKTKDLNTYLSTCKQGDGARIVFGK